jgi:hypothetical protein
MVASRGRGSGKAPATPADSTKAQVGPDDLQQARPHPGDPIQALEAPKGAMRIAVGHDDLGQPGSYSRKAGQLGGGGNIDVDLFPRRERACLLPGAIALGSGRSGDERGQELDLTRSLAGLGEQVTSSLPGYGQGEKEEQCPSLRRRHEGR